MKASVECVAARFSCRNSKRILGDCYATHRNPTCLVVKTQQPPRGTNGLSRSGSRVGVVETAGVLQNCRVIIRMVFGPRLWPGPQYDREYVRPRKFNLDVAQRAAEAMMRPLRAADAEAVQLDALWEAGGRGNLTASEVAALPEDELGDVKVSAYGALLQLGHSQPAMLYFGNDESRQRGLAGLAVIEREGRLLFWSPRVLAFGRIVALTFLATALVIVEFATNVGAWAWIAAGIAAALAAFEIAAHVGRLRQPPAPAMPHRVNFRVGR
jgi:hypothetical protein